MMPCKISRNSAGLAVLLLGSSLSALSVNAQPEVSPASKALTSGELLLSGARTAQSEFLVTTGFALKQNTIQLQARPGSGSSIQTFILDSGAPMTIAPQLERELGLKRVADIALTGPESEHLTVPVTRIPQISIAGLGFKDVGAVVDWVEPPNKLACLSSAGLMGASLLQTAIWQIDFQEENITISNSLSKLRGLEQAMKIPFVRSDASGSPRIAVGVSDADDVSLLIDLGFNGSIAIPKALLAQSGDRIADTAPTEEGQVSSTVFGAKSAEVSIARMRELRIGDLRLQDFPVVTGTAVSDFHVGIEFLRHFRVTLDWLHNDLYLEPIDQQSALYHDFASYGFEPELRDGALLVGAIWRGSAADKAGMQPGDRLVAIDANDTRKTAFAEYCGLLDELGLFGSSDAPVSVSWMRDGQLQTAQIARLPLLPQYAAENP